jgi:hypothetical protein
MNGERRAACDGATSERRRDLARPIDDAILSDTGLREEA